MKNAHNTYKAQGKVGLFDTDDKIEKMNTIGNPLEKLSAVIDFELLVMR